MLTPHMTCEITYKADPINKRRLSLEPSTHPVKVIKRRALHLHGPGGDVISKHPLRPSLKTQKERACHAKKNHAQSFVIDADGHIAALDELVNREQRIIRLSKRIDVGKRDHLVFHATHLDDCL